MLGYLKGAAAKCRRTCFCPGRSAAPAATCRTATPPATSASSYDPFVLNADPADPNFKVPDLLPPDYISAVRADRRQQLARDGGRRVSMFETAPDARQLDDNFQLAYTLMSVAKAREAFALDKEPEAVRERYGRNRFGQSCLLARRLIEAGVRFVTVNMFETVFDEITWDIHGSKPFTDISRYRELVGPNFDQAYSVAARRPERARPALQHDGGRRWASSAARRR